MRQLVLSPRWLLWHLLTLGAMATCGWLAVWQWQRAGSAMGSALNIGYGLQWPVFAVFFAFMWWRMLRNEAAELANEPQPEPQPAPEVPVQRVEPSPFGPRPVGVNAEGAEDGSALAEYNRMLAQLAARSED